MVITCPALPLLLALYGVSLSTSYGIRYRRSDETTTETTLSVSCGEGWFTFGEMCYKMFGQKRISRLNWEKASEACRYHHDGYLVAIHSQELLEFLTTFIVLSARYPVWIGLHDRHNESDYRWDDGSPVDYENWETTEPSGHKSDQEDCTEMLFQPWKTNGKSGKWNDVGCWNNYQYICQKDKVKQKSIYHDPRFCTPEEGGGWKFESSCFHLVTEPKNWTDAEQYCIQKHGGNLATITDFAINFYLTDVFHRETQDVWIGLKTNPDEEQQKWSSGWFVSFENWEVGDINLGCVTFSPEGKWNHRSCNREIPFICEKSTAVPPIMKPGPEGVSCPKQPKGWRDLGGDRCYFFDPEAEVTWADANFMCMRRGGTLASLHSKEEIKVLHNFLRYSVSERFYDVYIGLYRRLHDDEFAWADGSPVDFHQWAPNEDSSQSEQCVEIKRDTFLWNDIECGNKRGYFCSVPKTRLDNTTMQDIETTPDSSRFSSGAVVGVIVCVLFLSVLIGIVVYHFRLCDRSADRKRKITGHKLGSPSALDFKPRYRSPEVTVKQDDDAVYANMTP